MVLLFFFNDVFGIDLRNESVATKKKNQFQKISQRSLELTLRDGSHEWNLDESILEWFEFFSKFINAKCVIEQRTILELIDIHLLSSLNILYFY